MASAEDRDAVRRRVLDFRAKHPGTPPATAAAGLLRRLPSPLDRLPADGPFVRVTGAGPAVGAITFAADDSRLVVARAGRPPEEWTLPDLAPTARFPAAELGSHAASLTPDGRAAAGADAAGRLVAWAAGGVQVWDVTGVKARFVAVAPDGRTAVVVPADRDATLARVDLATGRVLGRLDVRAGGARAAAVAADGAACLLTGDDGARIVSLADAAPVRTIEPASNAPGPPFGVFAPDGGRLLLAGLDPTPGRYPPGAARADVHYDPRGDGKARPPRATAVAVSADDAAVAVGTGAGKVAVFAAGTGKATGDVTLPGGVKALAFSMHGRVLAAALDGGRVVLVPVPTRGP